MRWPDAKCAVLVPADIIFGPEAGREFYNAGYLDGDHESGLSLYRAEKYGSIIYRNKGD